MTPPRIPRDTEFDFWRPFSVAVAILAACVAFGVYWQVWK